MYMPGMQEYFRDRRSTVYFFPLPAVSPLARPTVNFVTAVCSRISGRLTLDRLLYEPPGDLVDAVHLVPSSIVLTQPIHKCPHSPTIQTFCCLSKQDRLDIYRRYWCYLISTLISTLITTWPTLPATIFNTNHNPSPKTTTTTTIFSQALNPLINKQLESIKLWPLRYMQLSPVLTTDTRNLPHRLPWTKHRDARCLPSPTCW